MSVFEEDIDVEEKVLETIDTNEEYRDILSMIVQWEEENPGENDNYDDFPNYEDTAWAAKELPQTIHPSKLGYLKQQGLIDHVMQTNNSNIPNLWALTDREAVKQALKIDKSGDVSTVKREDFDPFKDTPDDIFKPIVGHEDIKELFMASVEAIKPIHILLKGPPACGKTVFLDEVSRLPDSEYLVGSSTTGPGLMDELFEKRPHNILIDEFDKMDKSDYGNLLSLQEDGTVKETKGNNKRREMKLENATVYASANSIDNIPGENISRFLGDPVIDLPPYDDDKFHKVTFNVLTMREGASEELATAIADIIVDDTDIRDFRECRRIARLVNTESDGEDVNEQVRKYINIVQKYSSDSLM